MEIGGYFGLEEFCGEEHYPDLIALNTGRNALAYLIRVKKIKKLFIPKYLCDAIWQTCERENCDYELYEVGTNFLPILDVEPGTEEWIYIVNYFGQITDSEILKRMYKRIIFDNVQAFYQKPTPGIDTIYSCRKFFGVPDGAYLATDAVRMNLPIGISKDRMAHVLGRFEEDASSHYKAFCLNEDAIKELDVEGMSRLTHNILRAIDYEKVRRRREDNYRYLHNHLGKSNRLLLKEPIGPFAYPYYSDQSTAIRKALATKSIYIPKLWPSVNSIEGVARDYSEHILPLVCDQRYTIEDMDVIIRNVISYE